MDRNETQWSRRQWLRLAAAGGASGLLAGCAPTNPWLSSLRPAERALIHRPAGPLPIVPYRLGRPDPGSVLRRRADPAAGLPRADLGTLDRRMRESLRRAGGVGLAAPQVGVPRRVVLVELQTKAKPVITCVDPRLVRQSASRVDGYEACLSITGVGGLVARAAWVEVEYRDPDGRRHSRRSSGWEARIFQHELDHLDGRLYVDLAKGALLPIDEVRRRRRLQKRSGGEPRAWETLAAIPDRAEGVVL